MPLAGKQANGIGGTSFSRLVEYRGDFAADRSLLGNTPHIASGSSRSRLCWTPLSRDCSLGDLRVLAFLNQIAALHEGNHVGNLLTAEVVFEAFWHQRNV